MDCMGALQARGRALEETAHKWVVVGFLIFFTTMFFLAGNQQKTFFYFFVAIPALFLFARFRLFFRADAAAMTSVALFVGYFSLSALWSGGDGSLIDAAKYGLYILCLMLAAEAVSHRVAPQFLVGFIIVVGAIAGCAYGLAILLGETPLSTLVSGRSSFYQLAGWGSRNPISSACVLGAVVIAAWWYLPGRKMPIQLALIALMALLVGLMFLTKSRGPLLSMGVVLSLLILLRRTRADVLLLLFGLTLVAVIVVLSNIEAMVAERVAAPNYRLEIWSQVLQQFKENWLFGQGFGHDARIVIADGVTVTHSHSSLFEMFRVGGLLGGILFVGMTLLLIRHVSQRSASLFFLLWLIYGALCLSTNGRLLLIRPSIEWFAFWMPLFLLYFYSTPDTQTKFGQSDKGLRSSS